MKVINVDHAEIVHGGFCENMTLAECFAGSGEQLGKEIAGLFNEVGKFIGETVAKAVIALTD